MMQMNNSLLGNPPTNGRMGMMGSQGPMGNFGNQAGMPQAQMMMIEQQQQQMMMQQQQFIQQQMMQQGMNMNMNMNFNNQFDGCGMPMDGGMFGRPVRTDEACLMPPPPGMPPRSCRERPAGCRTIFIGGLPENLSCQTLRDLFSHMGNVVSCRLSKKNFAHIRFEREDSADFAIRYSGWTLCLNEETEDQKPARIHVDYAMARDDQAEYDERQKQYYNDLRQQMLGDEDQDTIVQYSDHEASVLQEQLRANDSFSAATQVLLTWLERGDCTRRTASAFYSMTQTAHSHVRRMAAEKQQFVYEFTAMQERFKLQLQTILMQFEQIEKVFVAAQKQKVWDHFTKAQRKNITAWDAAVKEAKKENVEFALNQRQEDEMDLSDQEDEGQAQSKKPRLDNKIPELKNQDLPLYGPRQQPVSATDDSHKNDEAVITFLRTALNNTQTKLLDYQRQIGTLKAQLKEAKKTATKKKPPAKVQKEALDTKTTEETKTDNTETDDAKTDETQDGSKSDPTDETKEEKTKTTEGTEKEGTKTTEETEKEGTKTNEEETKDTSEAGVEDTSDTEEETNAASGDDMEESEEEDVKEEPMSEMDKLVANAMRYASSMEAKGDSAPAQSQTSFTDLEIRAIGILSMYLHTHPYGAAAEYLCSYLAHLTIDFTPSKLNALLRKVPSLFYKNRQVSASEGETGLWCFKGFQN